MLFALIFVVLSGCATSQFAADNVVEAATDVPDHFLVGSHTDTTTTEPVPGEGCRNPMVDPRDGTKLSLIRSSETLADYEVPAGRYGVDAGQLLRLECGTGKAVSIVRR